MTPGPFGVPLPDWAEALRVRPPPVPSRLLDWEFRFCEPSYQTDGKAVSADGLLEAGLRVQPGAFLVADPGEIRPDQGLTELEWVQNAVPWCELVLRVANVERAVLDTFVRRQARGGVTVVPREGWKVADAASLLLRTTDPIPELEGALHRMLPRMAVGARAEAAALIRAGLRSALDPDGPERDGASTNRQTPFRLGRAMGACTLLQQAEEGESNLRVARRAGYATDGTLTISLKKTLGLGLWPIRRTVGWRWLLWRGLLVGTMRPHLRWERKAREAQG